jgi:hypothetical protein
VRVVPLPTLIAPGQNGAAVHDVSIESSGCGGLTDPVPGPVPGTNGDVVVPRNVTALPPATTSAESGSEILIGPGDLIEVSVYGAPD